MQDKDVPAKSGIGGGTVAAGAGVGLVVGLLIWALALNHQAPSPAAVPSAATATDAASSGPAATVAAETADTPTETAPTETAPTETAATPTAATPTAAPTVALAAAPTPIPAAIDTVRAEADGTVLVAGSAPPGTDLSIMVDGQLAATLQPDPSGKFATFLALGSSATPRVLSLLGKTADGQPLQGPAEVILNPTPAEPAVAEPQATVVAAVSPDQPAPAPSASPAAPVATAVAAPASPGVLVADESGVTKLTAAAPLSAVMIDTIGYDRLGNVDIAGRGGAAGAVRLYIDNILAATAPLTADGKWRAKLTDVSTGVHTLRADQIAADGTVASRVELPFQREEPAKVAVAQPPAADIPSPDATTATLATPAPATAPKTKARIITVQPGFTLWAIARASYGDGLFYVRVYEANKDQIRNPDLIYPGQVFTVPAEN